MKLRGAKRIVLSVAASTAMIGGLALAAPALASAAPASPTMVVSQDNPAWRNLVVVELTGPPGATCGAAAVELGRVVEVLADPIRIVEGGEGAIRMTGMVDGSPNPVRGGTMIDNGAYLVVGICGSVDQGFSDPVIQPIIVPAGTGSVESMVGFGSAVIENPDALAILVRVLPQFS